MGNKHPENEYKLNLINKNKARRRSLNDQLLSSTVHSDVDTDKETDKNLRLRLKEIKLIAQPERHDHILTCKPCNRNFKYRSDIYAHYSRTHYKKELLNILGENDSPECGMGK